MGDVYRLAFRTSDLSLLASVSLAALVAHIAAVLRLHLHWDWDAIEFAVSAKVTIDLWDAFSSQ